MSGSELRDHIRAVPFRPFLLNVADGRRVPVVGRDFVYLSPSGRQVHVYQRDESLDILDMLLVTGVSFEPPPAAPEPAVPEPGNGPARG